MHPDSSFQRAPKKAARAGEITIFVTTNLVATFGPSKGRPTNVPVCASADLSIGQLKKEIARLHTIFHPNHGNIHVLGLYFSPRTIKTPNDMYPMLDECTVSSYTSGGLECHFHAELRPHGSTKRPAEHTLQAMSDKKRKNTHKKSIDTETNPAGSKSLQVLPGDLSTPSSKKKSKRNKKKTPIETNKINKVYSAPESEMDKKKKKRARKNKWKAEAPLPTPSPTGVAPANEPSTLPETVPEVAKEETGGSTETAAAVQKGENLQEECIPLEEKTKDDISPVEEEMAIQVAPVENETCEKCLSKCIEKDVESSSSSDEEEDESLEEEEEEVEVETAKNSIDKETSTFFQKDGSLAAILNMHSHQQKTGPGGTTVEQLDFAIEEAKEAATDPPKDFQWLKPAKAFAKPALKALTNQMVREAVEADREARGLKKATRKFWQDNEKPDWWPLAEFDAASFKAASVDNMQKLYSAAQKVLAAIHNVDLKDTL